MHATIRTGSDPEALPRSAWLEYPKSVRLDEKGTTEFAPLELPPNWQATNSMGGLLFAHAEYGRYQKRRRKTESIFRPSIVARCGFA